MTQLPTPKSAPIALDLNELEFAFSRSSGPGGQNVNKVNSRCQLKWHPSNSSCMSASHLKRFTERYSNKLNQDGALIISSDRTRSQMLNREDCVEKLLEMIQSTAHAPVVRKATRPTFGSKKRRLNEKKKTGDKKRFRGRNARDD